MPPVPVGGLSGAQFQLDDSAAGLIRDREPVRFNQVIHTSGSEIAYTVRSGEFLLSAEKEYFVTWWVSVDGTDGPSNLSFALALDGVPFVSGLSPQVTGQLSGVGLIPVRGTAGRLSLVNHTGGTVRYASEPVQANIAIVC